MSIDFDNIDEQFGFLHLFSFRPTKIYIRTLKGADINFVGNSLKDYKPLKWFGERKYALCVSLQECKN